MQARASVQEDGAAHQRANRRPVDYARRRSCRNRRAPLNNYQSAAPVADSLRHFPVAALHGGIEGTV